MALHDNPMWILSHIKNSFIVSDNTANSQLLFTDEHKPYLADIAQREGLDLRHEKCLNPFGDDDDDSADELSKSVEIRPGNRLRPRCNTERKLEKMKHDRKNQIPVRTISWQESHPGQDPEQETLEELFPKKHRISPSATKDLEASNRKISTGGESLLSKIIENSPQPVENPFADYSRFDGFDNAAAEAMTVRVVLKALNDSMEYIEGRVHPLTLVKDVIGFICWKYVNDNYTPTLKSLNIDSYSLYMADPDGSIDWELRPLEKSEVISRFGFTDYAIVNNDADSTFTKNALEVKVTLPDGTYTIVRLASKDITAQGLIDKVLSRHKVKEKPGVSYSFHLEGKSFPDKPLDPNLSLHTVDDTEFFIVRQNSRRCTEFEPSDQVNGSNKILCFYVMDASTYQEYRDMFLLVKIPMRSRIAVVLAISQDRFDVIPHQTPSAKIWAPSSNIPKEGTFDMEHIVACEISEKPEDESEFWTFRIILEHKYPSYKKVYFQGPRETVSDIQTKMTNLLQWHSSHARANYIAYKEMKKRRRKTNIF